MSEQADRALPLDLSNYDSAPPARPLHLLFIHHSCGGQLLAAPGPEQGTNCIYATHPNGGGLRSRLEKHSYIVHEASYGSRIGQNTDLFDWLPKFRDNLEQVLTCDAQDARHPDGRRNDIVLFKSCFPNNAFRSEGRPPGNPAGPELTVWNAKAAYLALLEEFRKHPGVLFVCVTAPPLAPKTRPLSLGRRLLKKIRGQDDNLAMSALLARQFNQWLAGEKGWLNNGDLTNVVVFDYFHILSGGGGSGLSLYPTAGGYDSHPSREGNEKAAAALALFLNRAVRRAGLTR